MDCSDKNVDIIRMFSNCTFWKSCYNVDVIPKHRDVYLDTNLRILEHIEMALIEKYRMFLSNVSQLQLIGFYLFLKSTSQPIFNCRQIENPWNTVDMENPLHEKDIADQMFFFASMHVYFV